MYDFNSIYRAKSVEDAINELEKNTGNNEKTDREG